MNIDKTKYTGIFTALLTPFDKEGKVNHNTLEKLVKFNVEKGVKGFYVCGSTGEAFLLSADERKAIMETVKAAAPDSTLIAHIGTLNQNDAIALGKHANSFTTNSHLTKSKTTTSLSQTSQSFPCWFTISPHSRV